MLPTGTHQGTIDAIASSSAELREAAQSDVLAVFAEVARVLKPSALFALLTMAEPHLVRRTCALTRHIAWGRVDSQSHAPTSGHRNRSINACDECRATCSCTQPAVASILTSLLLLSPLSPLLRQAPTVLRFPDGDRVGSRPWPVDLVMVDCSNNPSSLFPALLLFRKPSEGVLVRAQLCAAPTPPSHPALPTPVGVFVHRLHCWMPFFWQMPALGLWGTPACVESTD
jgi:hypothetical protein